MRLSSGLFPFGYLLALLWALFLLALLMGGAGGLWGAVALASRGDWFALVALAMGVTCTVGPIWGFYKLAQAVVPAVAVVGNDGVAVHGIGRREFVPYRRVQGVATTRDGVLVTTAVGRDLKLQTSSGWTRRDEARDRLAARIEGALAARDEALVSDAELSLLDRSGRTGARWREELLALSRATADYRRPTVAPELLASVVDDVGAAPQRRIAAAVALSAVADEPLRRRLRLAASASASRPLRVALERALDGALDERSLTAAEADLDDRTVTR